MDNSQLRTYIRQLIIEAKKEKIKKTAPKKMKKASSSVATRLGMIDEAGNKAALQAKIAKIEEDIKEAQEIKNAIPENVSHFVAPKIISDMHNDLAASIEELQEKKAELEEQMSTMDKTVDEANKKMQSAQKGKEKMMGENKGTKNFTYTDASGKTKFVTADNIDQAKETAKKFGADPKTVKEKTAPLPIAPKK
jgi:chromosome segregation ATPase